MAMITDRGIQAAARKAKASGQEVWLTDDAGAARGAGRMRLCANPAGEVRYYFRYSADGKRATLALGLYDPTGSAGLTLKRAREEAGALSRRYMTGQRDLRAILDHEQAEEHARIESAARARADEKRMAGGTFGKLLLGYIEHLKRQGKKDSARDVGNLFAKNIEKAYPHLWALPARQLTHRDVNTLVAKMVDRGVGRSASKLRSYVGTAFSAALASDVDGTIHSDLHNFGLTANPVALLPAKPLRKFNKSRERTLKDHELRAFLKVLAKRPGTKADAVLLGLLLGGQRPAQLVRLQPGDVDLSAREVVLWDGKGARTQPRKHTVPLTERAAEIVERLLKVNSEKPSLFTLRGKKHITPGTLSDFTKEIVDQMLAEKIISEPFQLRDVRRSAETELARLGVSKDVRAQLLSHGLSGVQQTSYDKFDYAVPKRLAVEALDARLAEIESGVAPEKVVSLRAKRKA